MNLLIVDDEMPAVQGILNIVHWDALPFEHVYTAYSVREATQQLMEHGIDVLLTDIEMQDGTGFDLMRWCAAHNPACVSIILSGFPNFSYAQRAISLGVFEYLLKPVESAVLEATLRRASGQINRRDEEMQNSSSDAVIKQVQAYIIEHIGEEISRDDLADHIGFSPQYLSTTFKRETGLTLSDYIREERVAFAKRLLGQTNLPISVIAQNVGYESFSYFSSIFRQSAGCTPREYRKKQQEA